MVATRSKSPIALQFPTFDMVPARSIKGFKVGHMAWLMGLLEKKDLDANTIKIPSFIIAAAGHRRLAEGITVF